MIVGRITTTRRKDERALTTTTTTTITPKTTTTTTTLTTKTTKPKGTVLKTNKNIGSLSQKQQEIKTSSNTKITSKKPSISSTISKTPTSIIETPKSITITENVMKAYTNKTRISLSSPEEDLYSIKSSSGGKFETHVEHLAGPVMFSAPHGLQVYRGGDMSNDSERVHSKELYTNEICLLLSLQMKKYLGIEGSFVIWNQKTAVPKDKKNLDPNYLVAEQFMDSPFHLFLHKLKKQYEGFPTLHIDIHGKINRKDNRNIDIGIAPMMALWKDRNGAVKVKQDFCQRMQLAVSSCKKTYSGFKLTLDKDPYLSGYWGDDTVTTISHQSILLDMPALQLEIPMDVRKDLLSNYPLLDQIAKAIAETYKNSVTSLYCKEWSQIENKLEETKMELSIQQQTKHNPTTFNEMILQMMMEFSQIESLTSSTKKI